MVRAPENVMERLFDESPYRAPRDCYPDAAPRKLGSIANIIARAGVNILRREE